MKRFSDPREAGVKLRFSSDAYLPPAKGRRRPIPPCKPQPPAPNRLQRRQRRAVERRLRELVRRGVCSVCGNYDCFEHGRRVTAGLDANGHIVLAGECCSSRVVEIFRAGLILNREYDFLPPLSVMATDAQIAEKVATTQKLVAYADTQCAGVERRGGGGPIGDISLRDHPWKSNDREWFKRNPSRAHRMRLAYPGELEDETTKDRAGHTRIMLVRQVEPGNRVKNDFYIRTDLLSLPDTEAVAHALFELAVRHEPMPQDGQQLYDLFERYTVHGGTSC
jgi:hypothetical protein